MCVCVCVCLTRLLYTDNSPVHSSSRVCESPACVCVLNEGRAFNQIININTESWNDLNKLVYGFMYHLVAKLA